MRYRTWMEKGRRWRSATAAAAPASPSESESITCLRTSNRSNYVSSIDAEKCVACGQCVENCQVNALHLGRKLCAKTPVPEKEKDTPHDHVWMLDKKRWNPQFRYNRDEIDENGTAPCKTNCPAHIAVQGYLKKAAQGKYRDALALIKKENPFPAVCGHVCNRRCEDACTGERWTRQWPSTK